MGRAPLRATAIREPADEKPKKTPNEAPKKRTESPETEALRARRKYRQLKERSDAAFDSWQEARGRYAEESAAVIAGLSPKAREIFSSFIRKEKIPPTTTFTVGQQITATVSEVDKRRHKIILVPVLLEKPIGYR